MCVAVCLCTLRIRHSDRLVDYLRLQSIVHSFGSEHECAHGPGTDNGHTHTIGQSNLTFGRFCLICCLLVAPVCVRVCVLIFPVSSSVAKPGLALLGLALSLSNSASRSLAPSEW